MGLLIVAKNPIRAISRLTLLDETLALLTPPTKDKQDAISTCFANQGSCLPDYTRFQLVLGRMNWRARSKL
jgi:hypothetical protein